MKEENNKKHILIAAILLFFYIAFIVYAFIPVYYIEYYIDESIHLLSKIIASITKTEFFTAAIGAFFGAAGGAWIIHRYERKLHQRQDLASLNRALGIIASINTTLINIKKDYSIPQVEELYGICDDVNNNNIRFQNTGVREPLEIETHHIISQLTPPSLPSKDLLEMLTKYSKAGPTTFLLTTQLDGFCHRLTDAINQKNEYVQKFGEDTRPSNEKVLIYLGFVDEDGKTNDMIPSLIKVVEHEIDNALFMTRKIEKLLVNIGQGKIRMAKKVVELKFIGDMEQYFPPEDYVAGYGPNTDASVDGD